MCRCIRHRTKITSLIEKCDRMVEEEITVVEDKNNEGENLVLEEEQILNNEVCVIIVSTGN